MRWFIRHPGYSYSQNIHNYWFKCWRLVCSLLLECMWKLKHPLTWPHVCSDFVPKCPIKPSYVLSTQELKHLWDIHPWTHATLPRVAADVSFDAELLTASLSIASFSCCLWWGGCREKMQICRLVGLRFFQANEVVSLFFPIFTSKAHVFIIYFLALQQCCVSPAAVSALSSFSLSRHRLQIMTLYIPMKWSLMKGD